MKKLTGKKTEEAKKYFQDAAKASLKSRCLKRPRGAVIVKDGKIIGSGANAPADDHICQTCLRDKKKPKKFETFNTEPCYAVHAEQKAIVEAFKNGNNDLTDAKMYFVRTENGKISPTDDGPSCTICSKLILESGIKSFIYETVNDGVVELSAKEFNTLSLQYVENTN